MSKGEGDYNSVNLGKRFSNRSSTRDLSNMSVNELMRAQEQREFNAAGRYQMIPETFKSGVKSLGLSGNERMTPELQDRFFYDYLIKKAGVLKSPRKGMILLSRLLKKIRCAFASIY